MDQVAKRTRRGRDPLGDDSAVGIEHLQSNPQIRAIRIKEAHLHHRNEVDHQKKLFAQAGRTLVMRHELCRTQSSRQLHSRKIFVTS